MRLPITLAVLITIILSLSASAATLEARTAFKSGHTLLAGGKNFEAINSFKLTLNDRSYPLLDYSYYYIARAYQNKRRVEEALQVYNIVLNYFKDSLLIPRALFAVARLQAASGQRRAAAKTLREMIARFPGHDQVAQARYLLGTILEKGEKYTDAARVYRNLDLLHPKSDWAEKALAKLDNLAKSRHLAGYEAPAATLYNLGVKYFKKRNYSKAKEYFYRLTKYYKRSSFYDEAAVMLGRLFLRKGKLAAAVNYFKKAINLNKDSKPFAMFYLALTYGYQDSPRAAIRTLEKIVTMYPNSPWADDALYNSGRYYQKLEKPALALAAYEKLVVDYPHSSRFSDALWLIGNSYYKQGRHKAAYEIFARAFELPADRASDRLIFWAAKCAAKIKRADQAIAAYKATVARYDHSYYGYRAREELQKYGINLKANSLPEVNDPIAEINGPTAHEQKYRELIALGLGDEAAAEAAFIEEKVPLSKKDKVRIAKYHAYVMKGKFAKPIWFADKKIQEAMYAGSLTELDPRLWRFSYPRGYWRYVEKYSKKYGLDPHLTYAVIREESRFKSRALSRSWAYGLMQIIPSTGRRISRALGMRYSRWKMYNPRVNIQLGTYYLSQLIKRFDGNVSLALAAYNGGPVRVKKWTKKYSELDIDEFVEDIPIRETRNYVKKVMKSYYGYKRTYPSGG